MNLNKIKKEENLNNIEMNFQENLLNKNWSIGFVDSDGSVGGCSGREEGGGGTEGIVGNLILLLSKVEDEWRIAKNFPSGVRIYEPRDAFIRWIRTPAGICSRSEAFNWTSKAKNK
jgi:hypothetical protein